jgi:hypothetical protein
MSKNINSDDRRTEIALARYTLTLAPAPQVQVSCPSCEKRAGDSATRCARTLPPRSTTFRLA